MLVPMRLWKEGKACGEALRPQTVAHGPLWQWLPIWVRMQRHRHSVAAFFDIWFTERAATLKVELAAGLLQKFLQEILTLKQPPTASEQIFLQTRAAYMLLDSAVPSRENSTDKQAFARPGVPQRESFKLAAWIFNSRKVSSDCTAL